MLFLEDDTLKLEDAVKIAISQEAADASTKLIRQANQQGLPLPTNKVSNSNRSRNQTGDQSCSSGDSGKSCFGCGSKKHVVKDCPHKEVECFKCHNKGHYAKFCSKLSTGKQPGNKTTINNVNEKEPLPPEIYIQVLMNGRYVNLEWDTGSIVKKSLVCNPAADQEEFVVVEPLESDEEEDVPDPTEEPERELRYPVRHRRAPARYPLN
ncbi:unnamed protein product [Orchesella dallaii]|uniref:CCHC-type domain-containing protein n=1 Tax=Orchesella dallaii TaxID=48710 RepID=A0ABP1R637_9HEXA